MRVHWLIAGSLCCIMSGATAQTAAQPAPGPEPAAQKKEVPEYERIGRFIYAFHRAGVSREKLADPLIARRAPPDLAQRAAELARKYDRILEQRAAVPDEEIRTTLREAEDVGAAIRQWWSGQAG